MKKLISTILILVALMGGVTVTSQAIAPGLPYFRENLNGTICHWIRTGATPEISVLNGEHPTPGVGLINYIWGNLRVYEGGRLTLNAPLFVNGEIFIEDGAIIEGRYAWLLHPFWQRAMNLLFFGWAWGWFCRFRQL